MDSHKISKRVVTAAEAVTADATYVYDPDHKSIPEGGGWERTRRGWTRVKRSHTPKTQGTPEERRRRIHDLNTPTSELVDIYNHSSGDIYEQYEVIEELVNRPETPRNTLDKILEKGGLTEETIGTILKHPNCPPTVQSDYAGEGRLEIAENENATPLALGRLIDYLEDQERYDEYYKVLENKNVSSGDIDRVADSYMRWDDDEDERDNMAYLKNNALAVIEHPNAEDSTLERLTHAHDKEVADKAEQALQKRVSLKSQKSDTKYTPQQMKMVELSKSNDYKDREVAANSKETPVDVLVNLSKDDDYFVQRDVASNPNLPAESLRDLSKHIEWAVRYEVAGNPSTPDDVIALLKEDEDWRVRQNAAKRDQVSTDRKRAMDVNTSEDDLDDLAKSEDIEVRRQVAANPSTRAKTLGELAIDKDAEVRQHVARSLNTNPFTLETMAKDEDEGVRVAVAKNPNTHLWSISDLVEDSSERVREIAMSRLHRLSQKQREALADSNKTSSTALKELSHDDSPEVRERVASNKMTPKENLSNLTLDSRWEVRAFAAGNPMTPTWALDDLAKDKWTAVRLNTALNPSASTSALESLANDSDRHVSRYAKANLQNRKVTSKDLKSSADKGDQDAKAALEKRRQLRHDYCASELGDEATYSQMREYKKSLGEKGNGVRSPDQVRKDFIRRMSPDNYETPQAYQAAKKRIMQMPVDKFDKLLSIIYNKDEEEI